MAMLWGLVVLVLLYRGEVTSIQTSDYVIGRRSITEADIIKDIMSRDSRLLGLPRSDTPLNVKLGMYVKGVTEVDPEQGVVQILAVMHLEWTDPRLRFLYSQPFHDIQDLFLNPDLLWRPDLELYNPAPGGLQGVSWQPILARLYYNGTVGHVPVITARVFCDIQSQLSKNQDTFQCPFTLGSWSYPADQLDISVKQVQAILGEYQASGRWRVTEATVARHRLKFDCCPRPFVFVTFTLTFKRREF